MTRARDIAGGFDSRKNVIINGDMKVAQRGTSFVSLANNTYVMDRWVYGKSGIVVHTVTQETTGGPNDNFPNWVKLNVTTADASLTGSDHCYLEQRVEGYNYLSIREKEVAISFWVRDAKTGLHAVTLRSGDGLSSYISEYTITQADTWEYKTVTVIMSEAFGTWNLTNGSGFYLDFILATGPNFQNTANTWVNAAAFGTSSTVNSVDNTSNVFGVTGVQLEIGSSATAFEYRPIEEEVALCYRYYIKYPDNDSFGSTFTGIAAGMQDNSTDARFIVQFPVEMRVAPTVSISGSGNLRVSGAGTFQSVTGLNNSWTGKRSCMVETTGPSVHPAGRGVVLNRNSNVIGYMDFDAEL